MPKPVRIYRKPDGVGYALEIDGHDISGHVSELTLSFPTSRTIAGEGRGFVLDLRIEAPDVDVDVFDVLVRGEVES